MYVCLCNGHRDRELRALGAKGVSCVRDAYRRLGADPACGQCLDFAQDILDEARKAASPCCTNIQSSPMTMPGGSTAMAEPSR